MHFTQRFQIRRMVQRSVRWSVTGLLVGLAGIGCTVGAEMPRTGTAQSAPPGLHHVRSAEDEALVHNHRAGILFGLDDLAGATQELREAIRLSPDSSVPHSNLGKVLHAQGDLSGAEAELRKALTLDPRFAEARNNLAFVLYDRGDLGAAVEEWEVALRLAPNWPGAWAGMALGLFAFGHVDGALESYSRALRMDDHYADVEYLQRVRRWSPGAAGQAEAILRLLAASKGVSS